MKYQFSKHYTRDEARALLPRVRRWLAELDRLRAAMEKGDRRMTALLERGDVGGDTANGWVRSLASLQELLQEFEVRQIQLKDLERGLVDFPAIIGGREVFLCWEKDEDDIEFWHDIDTGYAGRERL
ncbi:MAG TPA: DUF2203 domain-containing protein [Verrucomicrobiae bacterium]|nr:DUF2203 domain-containing protein [Verrucomicrobiae bacterium]